jgi:hypothetical protein
MPPLADTPPIEPPKPLAIPRRLEPVNGGERPAGLKEFGEWARKPDNPTSVGRVRLVIAGPGGGKTWFINQLRTDVADVNGRRVCLHLDCHSTALQDRPFDDRLNLLSTEVRRDNSHVVLLIDGYDDLGNHNRATLEQELLAGYVSAKQRMTVRLVIATRDFETVGNAVIRNQAAIFTLKPLDDSSAIEQIRRRCTQLNAALHVWRADHNDDTCHAEIDRILEPPTPLTDADFRLITPWTETLLDDLPADLEPWLAGNPFINNLVLWYALHNDGRLAVDHPEAIWRHYLWRAKLDGKNGNPSISEELLAKMHEQLPESWTEQEFATKFGYGTLDDLNPLFEQGVLVTSEDQGTYGFHSDFAALLRLRGANPPAA